MEEVAHVAGALELENRIGGHLYTTEVLSIYQEENREGTDYICVLVYADNFFTNISRHLASPIDSVR